MTIHTYILTPAKSGADGRLEMPVRMEQGTLTLETKEPTSQYPRRVGVITNRAGEKLVLEMDALFGLYALLHDLEVKGQLK